MCCNETHVYVAECKHLSFAIYLMAQKFYMEFNFMVLQLVAES